MDTEALIVGGGPAGAAAALTLARAGVGVALLERSDYSAPRIGETLPPEASVTLAQLGVWERFSSAGHLPSPGIVSVWGSDQPSENDFIYNPYGPGWHLDRRLFDCMMVEEADGAGARVHRGARLLGCRSTGANAWEFGSSIDGKEHSGRCKFLIDATGRAAVVARNCGTRKVVQDRLVGVVGFFGPGADGTEDARTLVEAWQDGWWYSARLPEHRLVVALMTDSDFVPREKGQLQNYWLACLAHARHTRARVPPAKAGLDLRIAAANSSWLDKVGGEGWLAVGDAAMAFDPLSSQGIATALESGRLAAECVLESFSGSELGIERYISWTLHRFQTYRREWVDYYRRERRWPESPFWCRRAGLARDA